jgi:hypothetical protein
MLDLFGHELGEHSGCVQRDGEPAPQPSSLLNSLGLFRAEATASLKLRRAASSAAAVGQRSFRSIGAAASLKQFTGCEILDAVRLDLLLQERSKMGMVKVKRSDVPNAVNHTVSEAPGFE